MKVRPAALLRARILAGAALLVLPTAHSATLQWDSNGSTSSLGGTGIWDTSALNLVWDIVGTGGDVGADPTIAWPNLTSDTAIFGGTAGVVTVSGTVDVGNLAFTTTGYTLQTGTINLGAAASTITVDSSLTATVGATLSGNALEKLGTGTLILTGTNTYSGGTIISAGTLQIGNGNTGGSITGNIVNNGTLYYDRQSSLTLSGDISGTGNLRVEAPSNRLTLTGTNTFSGSITFVNTGGLTNRLRIGAGGTTGSITGNVIFSASTNLLEFNRSDDWTYAGVISGSGRIEQLGSGTLTLTGANTYTGTTNLTAGTLQIGNGGTTGSIGSGAITNNTSLIFNRSDNVSHAAAISGAGSLTQAGPGTLTLSGDNTYTGGTTLTAGTLSLGSSGAIGTSGTIAFAGGALQFTASNTTDYSARFSTAAGQAYKINTNGQTVTFATGLTSAGGTLDVSGLGGLVLTGDNTFTGGTSVAGGTTLFIGNGGTSGTLAGDVALTGSLAFKRSDASTYAGAITGDGTLAKQGAGTLTLTGAGTHFTADMYIADGTVEVATGSAVTIGKFEISQGGGLAVSGAGTAVSSGFVKLGNFGGATTLSVGAGASLSASILDIGAGTGTTGAVTVTGGTLIAGGSSRSAAAGPWACRAAGRCRPRPWAAATRCRSPSTAARSRSPAPGPAPTLSPSTPPGGQYRSGPGWPRRSPPTSAAPAGSPRPATAR